MDFKVKIRKFRRGDEYEVAKIIRDTNRVTLKNYYSPAVIEQMSADANARIIRIRAVEKKFKVAVYENKIVGIIGGTENRIRSFFVHPSYQGKGIGRSLLEFIEAEIKKINPPFIQVNSSLFAVNFYKHFGYKKIKNINSKTKKGVPFEVVFMKKNLSKP